MSSPSRVPVWLCWSTIATVELVAHWGLVEINEVLATAAASDISELPGPSLLITAAYSVAAAPFLAACLGRLLRTVRSDASRPRGHVYLEAFTVYVVLANLALFFLDSEATLHLLKVIAPLGAVAYAFAICRSMRTPLADWGWRLRGAGLELAIGVLIGLGVVAVLQLRKAVAGPGDAALFLSPAGLPFLLGTGIWTPIAEETLFRGMIHRYLRERLRWPLAVVANAAFFGAMHFPPRMAPALVSGFFYALLREWRGSLLAPIAAHATVNLLFLLVL